MTEQEAKQEAQRIVEKHYIGHLQIEITIKHALLEVQSKIDLLEEVLECGCRIEQEHYLFIIKKANNLKQVKAQIEKL